ncbi:hypothetical protein F5883DRAFT_655364 [Diaporthe sp. PMI_573]|nr:hypothetical protein F5883DRAFT_655364 [Diaporthaceae sp. PMI_573]
MCGTSLVHLDVATAVNTLGLGEAERASLLGTRYHVVALQISNFSPSNCEDYESQGSEVPETQSQGIKGEDDDLAICPDDTLWTTGHAIRAISPPPRRPVGGQEDEWRDHEEDHEAEHENPYTHTQVARTKMAGNTPWASQLFPDPTQESVPASLVTGDEPYSAKLANFTDALTQLPDTQGQSQETDATEEDGAEGQQSSCPSYKKPEGRRAAVDVVGAFAERLMKGLLDLGSEHGAAASMTVTADRVVLEVRLDRSQRGG